MNNKFSERLRELRTEKGITQAQLGKATGYSQAGIAKWETGDRKPTIDAIISLSNFFECTSDYLIGLVDSY